MVGGARSRGGARPPSLSQQLAAKASKKSVRPVLGLHYYYRAADMLQRQSGVYRVSGNEEELYVILMRYASLVLETIPEHSEFQGNHAKYQTLKVTAVKCIEELERLKLVIDTKETEQKTHNHVPAPPPPRPDDVVQVRTSMLPEADWNLLRPPTASLSRGDSWRGPPQPETPLSPTDNSQNGSSALEQPATGDSNSSFQLESYTLPPELAKYRPSEATRQRHCLVGPMNPSNQSMGTPSSTPSQQGLGALYNINLQASVPIQLASEQPVEKQQSSEFQDPLVQELTNMQIPLPSAPPATPLIQQPQLGPQMIDVMDMAPPQSIPGPQPPSDCSCPPDSSQVAVVPSGDKPTEKIGIKDVHISVALMEEFMKFASSNTRKGIESCGILAGKLDAKTNTFTITTLIIPHQEGTRDTVSALNEEDIFETQDSRGLYPLGWIHTHPTQTCFLSSVDVHTQVGYQTLLDEAVAIVMAPTDRSKRCGIFRLTTPGGLKLIQRCPQRGFHSHPDTSTGQPIYELCGHVYLNPRIKLETIDLRH